MFTKRLLGAALAAAMLVAGPVANAGLFTILPTPGTSPGEATGLASGTTYPWPGGPGPGAGVPSQQAGWPVPPTVVAPGLATEPGVGLGTSGFDASYLQLNEAHLVTFQFMGAGTSTIHNSFWLFYDSGNGQGLAWHQLFQDGGFGATAGPTDPCRVGDGNSTVPACNKLSEGLPEQNQYTIFLPAGLIPFQFDLGGDSPTTNNGPFAGPINSPGTLWTNGIPEPGSANYVGATGNPPDDSPFPGYFLGIDPYAPYASGTFQTTGDAAYIGLSDLPRSISGAISAIVPEHDYQDMVIRVVPEPGSLLLLGGGLIALAGLRRRKA